MNEEQIRESNKLYQSGEYTLEELAKKYAVTIGKIRYGWKKFELPSKLSKEAKSKSMAKGALKRDNNIINKKRKNTNMERYGVENVSQLKEIKNKKEKTLMDRYGVKNCNQVGLKNFFTIENKEALKKWAEDFYKKYGKKPTRKDLSLFIGWSIDDAASRIIHKYGLEDKFSWKKSALEEAFEKMLIERNIEYEHNNREIISPLEIDYWIPSLKIGIEINDVASHNSDIPFSTGVPVKAINYHQQKSLKAVDAGIRLIHIYEWELRDEKYMDKIFKILEHSKPIYARNCELREVSKKVANEFLEEYHLQGKCNGNEVNLGLYYNNILVSVMTFGKPRHSESRYDWELLRYCSSGNIIGGASKLFSHFVDMIGKGKKVLSFQDLDKFSGNLYDELGFEYIETTKPSYVWVNRRNIDNRYSWFLILQKGVDNVLGTDYGKGMSNIDLMKKEGYVRVYNSGMRKFVYFS